MDLSRESSQRHAQFAQPERNEAPTQQSSPRKSSLKHKTPSQPEHIPSGDVVTVTLHADKLHQEIHSIGSNDSFGTEVLGRWGGSIRDRITQLLFDGDLDDVGQPRGIGLSGWRFRFGAGSVHTGECDPHHRYETFLNEDWASSGVADERSYDFTASPGRRYFLDAAKRYGVAMFTATVSAPPYTLTGAATNPERCSLWLPDNSAMRLHEYASYLARCLKHFKTQGVLFTSLSPVHTTHSGGGVVEGCMYSNEELVSTLHIISAEFERLGLHVRLVGPDSASIDFLSSKLPGHERCSEFLKFYRAQETGDHVDTFRFPESFCVVSGASTLSCWAEEGRLALCREQFRNAMQKYAQGTNIAEYWVSEYIVNVPQRDHRVPDRAAKRINKLQADSAAGDTHADLDLALHTARVILADLVLCNAASWNWGHAVGTEVTGGGLVSIDTRTPKHSVRVSKTLWALGHFSFFIKPGFRRMETTRGDLAHFRDNIYSVLDAAFLDEDSLAFVVIILNMGTSDRNVEINVRGRSRIIPEMCCFNSYITTSSASLTRYRSGNIAGPIESPAMSIMTLRGDLIEEGTPYVIRAFGSRKIPLVLQASAKQDGLVNVAPELRRDEDESTANPWDTKSTRAMRERQLWKIFPHPSGEGVMIQSSSLSIVLTVRDDAEEYDNGILPVHFGLPTSTQPARYQWRARKGCNGHFVFVNFFSGLALEAYGEVTRLAPPSGKRDQHWVVYPAEPLTPEPLSHHHTVEERKARALKRGIKTPLLFSKQGDDGGGKVLLKNVGPRQNQFSHKDFFKSQMGNRIAEDIPVATGVHTYKNPRYAVPHSAEHVPNVAHRSGETLPVPMVSISQPPQDGIPDVLQPHSVLGTPRRKAQHNGEVVNPQHNLPETGHKTIPHPAAEAHSLGYSPGQQTPYRQNMESLRPEGGLQSGRHSSQHESVAYPQRSSNVPQTQSSESTVPHQGYASVGEGQGAPATSLLIDPSEMERRRAVNQEYRRQRAEEMEAARQQEREQANLEHETRLAREDVLRREAEEARRAERHGTSHLVFNLEMRESAFDSAFKKSFIASIAKQLQISV